MPISTLFSATLLPDRVGPGKRAKARRRRVALLIRDLGVGGVGRNALQLARGLMDRGVAVDFVVKHERGPLRKLVPKGARIVVLEEGSPWEAKRLTLRADPWAFLYLLPSVIIPREPVGSYRRLPALVRYLEQTKPDGLISALAHQNLLAIAASRVVGGKTRVIVSEHSTDNALTRDRHSLKRWALPALARRQYLMADAIVTVSRGLADSLALVTGLPRERVTTIYNPVVGRDLRANAAVRLRHPWFQPGQPPVVLGVGRLQEQKDFPTLIRAFAQLHATRPLRLVILGRGPNRQKTEVAQAELRELARSLGVESDFDLPGYVANPYPYMARSGVFALSSAWEGFGNALVEAMACGCPVVSTDCPSGPAEILDRGRYGPMVPIGDDAALAHAMARMLDAPPDPDILRQRAAMFSVERSADAYLKALFGKAMTTSPKLASLATNGAR
jgi:glycosyltransferase involved in cell wall biosynthesis